MKQRNEIEQKTLSPYLLLLEIKEKLAKEQKITLEDLGSDIQENIKKIIIRCKKYYSDTDFCGNDALNREILLNPFIAKWLTPDTLIAIFKLEDKDMKLRRNGSFSPTIAGVLEYGFKQGLDVIKYIPNNAQVKSIFGVDIDTIGKGSQTGISDNQKQQEAFEDNTFKIINNIKQVSLNCDLNPEDEKFQIIKNNESPIVLFARVKKIIEMIREQGESHILLANAANSSMDSLRNDCSSCVKKLSILTKTNTDNSIINLTQFVKKCFEDPNYMLNDRISHSFYDRLHFEAGIEGDEWVIVNDRIYTISQIMEEMVRQCEEPETSIYIKQQFTIRLQLITEHLLEINKKLKKDYPGYNDILLGNVEIQKDNPKNHLELETWQENVLRNKESDNFIELEKELGKIQEEKPVDKRRQGQLGTKIQFIKKCLPEKIIEEKKEIIINQQPINQSPSNQNSALITNKAPIANKQSEPSLFDSFCNFFKGATNLSSSKDFDLEEKSQNEYK